MNRKKFNVRLLLDVLAGIITIVVFFVVRYFWICDMDFKVTALGVVVVLLGTVMLVVQDLRINK